MQPFLTGKIRVEALGHVRIAKLQFESVDFANRQFGLFFASPLDRK